MFVRFVLALGLVIVCSAPASAQYNLIVGGDPAPEMQSVGALLHQGEAFCTGTIIAPRVVLTAAHCLSDLTSPSGVTFFLGPDANDLGNGRQIAVSELHVHPDYAQTDNADIAVAILAQDADVDAIQVNTDALGAGLVGTPITFVGYGLTAAPDGPFGEKRKVVIAASGVSDFFIDYETPGKNTCNGDSGGPALVYSGATPVLIGVTSYGDADCNVDGHNTRADVFAPFVGAFLSGHWQGNPAVDDGGQIPIEPGTDPDDGEGDTDFCEEFGWYNDGECDECPTPDPDCDGEEPDDEEDDSGDDSGCNGGSTALVGLGAIALVVRVRRRAHA